MDVVEVLNHLHYGWDQVMLYRDIKLSNMLNDSEVRGQLGDFGLVKLYQHGDLSYNNLSGLIPKFPARTFKNSGSSFSPGVVVYEYELKIGWGKSVSLPAQALPAPLPGHMAIRSKEGGTVILSGPDGPPVTSVTNQSSELVLTPNVPDIMVVPPENDHLRHLWREVVVIHFSTSCLNLVQRSIHIMFGDFTPLLSSAPVKNAYAYRTKFEATLPDIMESFNDLYRSITGRITAEALKVKQAKGDTSHADILGSPMVKPVEIVRMALGTTYATGLVIEVWIKDEIFEKRAEKATIFSPKLK
uniref:Protein kinase domain-containing protein n=1 Tax=Nelumbo nucifera TaxID=4432 RepID=A0A822YJQ3_NELNU|nr:TPA_asm: hypothetical protein HUJ06_031066 [Nelumbo nucifera]